MKISCALYNGRGSSAQIESNDGDSIAIVEGINYSAKKACLLAAKRLRDLAEKFEMLAKEPNPYNYKVHSKINQNKPNRRHHKWYAIDKFLSQIYERLGNSIYDYRCRKSWDVEQAVCAEAYGEDWQTSKTFLEWKDRQDSDPPEPKFFMTAQRMADGYLPEWAQEVE